MHLLHRFLLLPFFLAALVHCLRSSTSGVHRRGLGACFGRGSGSTGAGFPHIVSPPISPPEHQLPPVTIDVTRHINEITDIAAHDFTEGTGTPGHRWRWRAAGGPSGAGVQVQVFGHYRAFFELRATAPADRNHVPPRPEIRMVSNSAVNGGETRGWGDVQCTGLVDFNRDDVTYVLSVSIG
ncbi:secreted in xylem 7 [Pyrenophora seminiperda CCB06]|uniref:Secreted in xylem 7 n=1 Tax=Pyrenophora seminiperda CCB06 TaxID=1302712 RepID=A0A3M7M2K8_9PLEO|nr:secreted in xylem 7 [Pyrenophora seminiperda CCB06]